ncbi:hypothetical protein SUSUWATARI_00260 [Serratia phage vB_SmaM-Susuwatari]|nr:hypothetical protein SUSUWATARI_00260 [Serratia phage vB_SmaM-Susuwatari]
MSKLEPVFFGFVDAAGSIVVDEFCVSTSRNIMQDEVDVRNRNEPGENYRTVALFTEDDVEALQLRNSELESQLADAKNKLEEPIELAAKYDPRMAGDKATKAMFYGRNTALNDCAKTLRDRGFNVVHRK